MKVLKFGAVWSPGCLVMRPWWEKIEKENPSLKTEYYDIDKNEEMAKKYKIEEGKLPVFIFLIKRVRGLCDFCIKFLQVCRYFIIVRVKQSVIENF